MTPREMYAMLRDARADIMLSGGRSQFVALKARMPWLDINQERHHAYAGYEGMVELVHQIDRALSNPVWQRVRIAASWGDDGETLPQAQPADPTAHLSAVAAHAMGLEPEEVPV
jgi:nitrogenase molybdenum-cofactor synthesis protein NifE